jgi:hypothetical protein
LSIAALQSLVPARSFAALLLVAGLAGNHAEAQAPRTGAAGGIKWTVPRTWTDLPGSAMRVANYKVPAAKGAEAGELAVFFFGPGQGGTVDANVQRWAGQFEENPKPASSVKKVGALTVTTVQIAGTYKAPGGPTMQSQGSRPGYRLLGAIVEAPDGLVFFKLTAPAATAGAAQADFDGLVASLTKG